jgi:hypothetical protein
VDLSGQRRGAARALRGERGQTSAEYVGMILVVVAIIAAISAADIGAAISVQVERAVCQIAADGGAECQAGAGREERSGARARPAPNLYDAEATPRLAGLNARSPKFVATGASARAETERAESRDATGSAQSRGATGSAGLPLALLTSPVLTPPVTSEGRDALRGFVKEWSGLGDAERAFEALAEGRYGEALVPGILALPWSKALKVGTKIVEKGAEKLGPQAKKLWEKLRDERGSVRDPGKNRGTNPNRRSGNDPPESRPRGEPVPPPKFPPGIPGLRVEKRKTPVEGGGGLRKRWRDEDGNIYEWDSRHGTVEKFDKRGRHRGELDPETGEQVKPRVPERKVEP